MSLLTALSNMNWLAVLVVWITHIVISLVWFHPPLFGKAWVKLSGKELTPATRWIPAGLAAHLVCVFALAVMVQLANATSLVEGIVLGLLAAICFIGAILAGELVWEKIPFKLFLIRLGDHMLTLSLAGAIFALWR